MFDLRRVPVNEHCSVWQPYACGACAAKGDRTLARFAAQFDVHPNKITSWKAQLEGGAADVFSPGGGNGTVQPAIDTKSLHAKRII
jgi:hypothetical protein